MLSRLRKGPLSISELAEPFAMSFAGVAKHVEVLSTAGLVRKVRAPEDGRSYRIELQKESLTEATAWLTHHQAFWADKLERLEVYMKEQDNENRNIKNRKKN